MISRYSIAVLPFTDSSPEQNHPFVSDGITIEIIHSLSRYPELHVTSRFSSSRFSARRTDIDEIRDKLNVAWAVDGNIRLTGEIISITAQLIRTEDGSVAGSFSKTSEFRNIPRLQDKIASSIATLIISNPDITKTGRATGPVHSGAMEEFMKGQYLLNQLESVHWEEMMEHFRRSLSLDPDFYRPMVAMCHSYSWLSSIGVIDPNEARKEIDKLIRRLFGKKHHISDVYQLQAEKYFWIDWKPRQALDYIDTALELNRSNAAALVMKGLVLASLGNTEESLEALFQAEKLDPFGDNVKYCIGLIYRYTGDYEKAYKYLEESLEIAPGWLAPYFTMMEILSIQHRFGEAAIFIGKSKSVPGFNEMVPLFNGLIAAFEGREEEAMISVEKITRSSGREAVIAPFYYYFGLICLQLRLTEEAVRWVKKGLQSRSTPFLFLHIDSSWDPLREDPRFIDLKNQSGLPDPVRFTSHHLKYRKSRLNNDLVNKLQIRLKRELEEKKVYLDPTLSLSDLAELCNVSVNQLSQYLNGNLGISFYDYMNRFRLNHFLRIAGNKEWAKMSILGMAYESGFNSKTTFNTFFKKELRVTPREYLKG